MLFGKTGGQLDRDAPPPFSPFASEGRAPQAPQLPPSAHFLPPISQPRYVDSGAIPKG